MRCPSCNYDNPADALFCMKCGTKVERRCSSCDTVNPADANFCRKCVGALGAAATAASPGPAAAAKTPRVEVTHERPTAEGLEEERKTVTALFADIKGSTELLEELDPEEARSIIDPALKLMIDAAHRYDGYLVQSTGTVSSRCSAHRSRTRTIRSGRCTRRCVCRKKSAATPTASVPRDARPFRFGSV